MVATAKTQAVRKGVAFGAARVVGRESVMGSKILLISVNRCAHPDPVFPLGLAYLDAALQRAGHSTRWLDFQIDGPSNVEQALEAFQPDFIGISLRNIDDVLIRKREIYFGDLEALCRSIRNKSKATIILGGSGFSIFPKELMAYSGADYGICGAGESSMVRLIAALKAGQEISDVPGLVYRQEGAVISNIAQPVQQEGALQAGNLPERLVRHYLETSGMLNVQTQRGCAFRCCYCTYPLLEGCKHSRRPAEAVADEMELMQSLGARYAFIVDSVFNSSPQHVQDVCEALLRRNLKIEWGCFMRPQGLSAEMLALMARAGLRHIEFGTDSFCDEVLHAYGKGFSFDDVLKSSELARKQDLDYCHFLISGGPSETVDTLQRGFENSRQLQGGIILAVAGMRIYPGTQLCQRAIREGVIDQSANLLAPVYYVAPTLTTDLIFERLGEFARQAPNWVAGDPSPAYAKLVAKLRQRRVAGPLWSYFSMIQRLWPQPALAQT